MSDILVKDSTINEKIGDWVASNLEPGSGVVMKAPPRFIQSPRIQKLAQRSRELAISGKRRLGTPEQPLGDHACWIHIGPFPQLDQMPSRVNGYEATGESWGRDYAFLVDHFPVEIHENERIVGEIHWEMHMVRQYTWPESVLEVGRWAAELGASGLQQRAYLPGFGHRPYPRVGAASWSESKPAGKNIPQLDNQAKSRPICTACR